MDNGVPKRRRASLTSSFPDYVASQLTSAERQLPGFKLLQTWDFELNGCPATLADYSWEREGRRRGGLCRGSQTFVFKGSF